MGSALRWTVRLLALIPLAVLALALATVIATQSGCGILPEERVDAVEYPDQGWGAGPRAEGRQVYYYTPQGAVLKDLRYSWFVNLEMPLSTRRLADPGIMRRYGFLVDDDGTPNPQNPDRLPVGFTKHFDRALNEELLDITCAACHTGQINVTRNGRTTALRVDGGSALHAFTDSNLGHFVPTLLSSILSTIANPLKYRRFARNVLGDQYDEGFWELRWGLMSVVWKLGQMGYHEKVRDLTPTEEGYGRTDALARIANTVFGDNIDASNYRQGSAPVNYPPVWNIWKFDWVQYNASVSQPMARNIGEAMGTGAKYALVDRYGRPLPPDERFRSTAMIENLHTIEVTLRRLQPPAWNEALLGPVDRVKAQRGKELFQLHCEQCHGPFIAPPAIKVRNAPLKTAADPLWVVRTVCAGDVGTDPTTAVNFARKPGMNITKTGLTTEDLKRVARLNLEPWRDRQAAYLRTAIAELQAGEQTPDTAKQIADLQYQVTEVTDPSYLDKQLEGINPADLTVGAGLSYLGVLIREKAYADNHYTPEQRQDRDGFGTLDLPQVIVGYKPRPLAGIWASPPFLHNGSVPTIYALLSPVAERPRTFRAGSREYDTEKLGLAPASTAYWEFDTTREGNYNSGHEFNTGYDTTAGGAQKGLVGPLLSPEDRLAIIEHLKIRNDDQDGPQTPKVPPQCAP